MRLSSFKQRNCFQIRCTSLTCRKFQSMKRFSIYPILILISIVLWGCPYKSSVPLSKASEYVNKQVLGKWIPKTQSLKENPEYYLIEKRDSVHYDVEHFQYNDKEGGYASKNYICWSTNIDGYMFLNVQESGQTEITLHRLDVRSDELMILSEVTSNIDEKFDNSADMYEFFDKYKSLSFFYTAETVKLIPFPKE